MLRIIFATANRNKLREIEDILKEFGVEVISMKDAGIDLDIEENGTTFMENAIIKAKAVAAAVATASEAASMLVTAEATTAEATTVKATMAEATTAEMASALITAEAMPATIVLADDSGLEIDYLNKEPGVYSSRYMGEDTSYRMKNQNLIDRLDGVPDERRTARFVCAIAAVLPDGRLITTQGVMEGRIAYEEKGENGFGYDPIFFLPGCGRTSAEIPAKMKNEISHRGQALRAMKKELESYLQ